jgi:glycosyltransferase involved in cell wall biosynthesis
LRILYAASYYKPAYVYGGPVRSVSTLCEELVRQGIEISVLTTNANGAQSLTVPILENMEVEGVNVQYFPRKSGPPHSFFYSPELVKAFNQNILHYDLVVIEAFFGHIMGPTTSVCTRSGIPYVIPLRGQLLPWSLRQKRLKKLIYISLFGHHYLKRAAGLYCTDPVEAESARKFGTISQIFTVPNGIDVKKYKSLPPRGGWRRKLGISDQAPLLLFLGRLHRKKRPDIAVSTLAAVLASHKDAALVLAGPDEENLSGELFEQAIRFGCNKNLYFVGLLKSVDLLQVLVDADLFLMPSEMDSENFGMAALEAMATGLPVLVSEGVPIGSWAKQANAGRVVACDMQSFVQAAGEMLDNPLELKAMGERGRELAFQHFDISVLAQEMIVHYQSILDTGHPVIEKPVA